MLYGEMPEVRLTEDSEPVRGFRFTVPNPPKTAILRLPTAAEMTAYTSREKAASQKSAENGRDPGYKADLDLFRKIKVAGDDFDEFEARIAIVKLTDFSLTGAQRTDKGFEITLKTPFGEHVHTMGIPTAKQLLSSVRSGQSPELYESAFVSVEGYSDPAAVPPHHKSAVANELMRQIDALYAGDFLPNS